MAGGRKMAVQPQKSPVTITLTRNPKAGQDDIFKVDKPLLEISPGDQLKFIFKNCKNPVIIVPVENIFTEARSTDKIQAGIVIMNVKLDAKIPEDEFPYMVYSPDTNVFAEGNSPPRMVLKSP
jgi:hypothetical protein